MHTETCCLSYLCTDKTQGQELLALNLNPKNCSTKSEAEARQSQTDRGNCRRPTSEPLQAGMSQCAALSTNRTPPTTPVERRVGARLRLKEHALEARVHERVCECTHALQTLCTCINQKHAWCRCPHDALRQCEACGCAYA